MRIIINLILLTIALTSFWTIDQNSGDKRVTLVGNWTGESVCLPGHPTCHDENVIYRIALNPNDSHAVTITMDKIVDGKPDTMGVFDFVYDEAKETLVSEFSRGRTRGRWEFVVHGKRITGTLITLPDKDLWRNVKVTKDE